MSQISSLTLLKNLEIALAEKLQELEYCEGKLKENRNDITYYEKLLAARRASIPEYEQRIIACRHLADDINKKIEDVKDNAAKERAQLKLDAEIQEAEAALRALQLKKAGMK